MKPSLIDIIVSMLVLGACTPKDKPSYLPVIPQPNAFEYGKGSVTIDDRIVLVFPDGNENVGKVVDYLSDRFSITLDRGMVPVFLRVDSTLSPEAYILDVSASYGVEILSAPDGSGWFYGVQTLMQLREAGNGKIDAVHIEDAPRFSYRGALMDPARNFMPKEFVFRFLDLMALYKLNVFHMHLTDDQGWRIEIDRYPRLTEVGASRPYTQLGASEYYFEPTYDGKPVSGYYTKDDIREIVAYAADRFITVIPEIDMPGHASAAIAAYPELSCGLKDKYTVQPGFGVFDDVFCPKKETFEFLCNVLDEVIDLFPGEYIMIGGDECPKKAWKACAHCQNLIKHENLADEHELQSYFIKRIEEHVNSRGRKIIGWDEILEGGLAPNATVMSWRGVSGGRAAALSGHDAIMAPSHWCYLNHYQQYEGNEPLGGGGFLPLDTVYSFEPVPADMPDSLARHIIGVQANIWGEFIQTPEYFEYMAFPRLLAMAEVQWTQPSRKNFDNFCRVLDGEFSRLDSLGVNAGRNFYEVNIYGGYNDSIGTYEARLSTFCPDATIEYTLDDSTFTIPAVYTAPVALDTATTVYARVVRDGKVMGRVNKRILAASKASGAKTVLDIHREMIDGYVSKVRDGKGWVWLGEEGPGEVTLDFGKPTEFSTVATNVLWRPATKLWFPTAIEVAVSDDGETFETVLREDLSFDTNVKAATAYPVSVSFGPVSKRYVRVTLVPSGKVPPGYEHAGEESWVGADELMIY